MEPYTPYREVFLTYALPRILYYLGSSARPYVMLGQPLAVEGGCSTRPAPTQLLVEEEEGQEEAPEEEEGEQEVSEEEKGEEEVPEEEEGEEEVPEEEEGEEEVPVEEEGEEAAPKKESHE